MPADKPATVRLSRRPWQWLGLNGAAVRHADFAQALARATGRPCEVTVAPPQVEESMGGAAELVLMSSRLTPRRAAPLDFEFRYSGIDGALQSFVQ